jgi:hypothetical protein
LRDEVIMWASEFDELYEKSGQATEQLDYYKTIDQFSYDKFSKLCADLGKTLITKREKTK